MTLYRHTVNRINNTNSDLHNANETTAVNDGGSESVDGELNNEGILSHRKLCIKCIDDDD